MHPEFRLLIRFVDGEASRREARTVQKHLETCPDCRAEVDRLRRTMEIIDQYPVPPVGDVLARMREWLDRRSGHPAANSRRQVVVAAIQPFLGANGAQTVIGRVSPGDADLISTVEPVLADFLGRRTAQILVDGIIDVAITRR